MKKKMVIDVVLGVKRRQGQPGKQRRKTPIPHGFPKHAAPLNMVVAIKVATTYGLSGKLQLPEYQADYDCADAEVDAAHRSLSLR